MNESEQFVPPNVSGSEKLRRENNPDNYTPRELLKKLGQLSNNLFDGKHPSVPDVGLADGTFGGSGELYIDENGCVVLTRIADDEEHLSKDWKDVSPQELLNTSEYHGGGSGIPTSGMMDWDLRYKIGGPSRIIGTFKIPVKDIIEMIRTGDAIIGNIGEGEIVLNPAAAKKYYTGSRSEEKTDKSNFRDPQLPDEITI